MYHKYPTLILFVAILPVIALGLGLLGVGPEVYGTVATRLLSGGWSAAGVLVAHVGPLAALLVYRRHLRAVERRHQERRPIVQRPAVDSGPFGRLIE